MPVCMPGVLPHVRNPDDPGCWRRKGFAAKRQSPRLYNGLAAIAAGELLPLVTTPGPRQMTQLEARVRDLPHHLAQPLEALGAGVDVERHPARVPQQRLDVLRLDPVRVVQ